LSTLLIQIDTTFLLGDVAALYALTKGLERRFPHHNGPFEYATRLVEEVGELVQALDQAKGAVSKSGQKNHIIGEQIDVIRTILGIALIYEVEDGIPDNFEDIILDVPDYSHDYATQLAVACGKVASTINHAEGMGIKQAKHGNQARDRVFQALLTLMQITLQSTKQTDFNDLRLLIAARYRHDCASGYID
jgi:NTP pyrophosphatase (non-canonical NTP hydrolase)